MMKMMKKMMKTTMTTIKDADPNEWFIGQPRMRKAVPFSADGFPDNRGPFAEIVPPALNKPFSTKRLPDCKSSAKRVLTVMILNRMSKINERTDLDTNDGHYYV